MPSGALSFWASPSLTFRGEKRLRASYKKSRSGHDGSDLRNGIAFYALADYANKNLDIVVMGSHGYGNFKAAVLGVGAPHDEFSLHGKAGSLKGVNHRLYGVSKDTALLRFTLLSRERRHMR